MNDLSVDHPDVSEFTTASELLGTREVPDDKEIPILFIGDREEDRPWIMLIGGHHGDEPDSVEAVLSFAEHLLHSYSSDEMRSMDIISNVNMAVLPVVNPHGLDLLERYDENNEDPNRDYPFEPSGPSLHSDGIPLTTAGAHAVHTLSSMYPFSIAISFHTGSKGVFYTWGATDVGIFTPDHASFSKIGAELSRSSGQDILHGPANSFDDVAYLTGAFDDHLYGSSFLGQHLYSPSMQLPWSTFTATVELDTMKGHYPGNLGTLEGLFDEPITDQGTVPMGVRICYSACQMVKPTMDAAYSIENGSIELAGRITGSLFLSDTRIFMDGEEVLTEIQWVGSTILPEKAFSASFKAPEDVGIHQLSISTVPDRDWAEMAVDPSPMIGPQSLIARSRENLILSWNTIFEVEEGPEPDFNATIIPPPEGYVVEVGSSWRIPLEIDVESGTPVELVIIAEMDDMVQVTRFPYYDVMRDDLDIMIAPFQDAGIVDLTINLTFENGDIIERSAIRAVPKIDVITATRIEDENLWSIHLSIQGGKDPSTIYWGVSRDQDEPWGGDEWTISPQVLITDGEGLYDIELDLNKYAGAHFFLASTVVGPIIETFQIRKVVVLDLDVGFILPDVLVTVIEDDVYIGPAIIITHWDGPETLSPGGAGLEYRITLTQENGGRKIDVELIFKERHQMNRSELMMLDEIAEVHDIEGAPGAFFGVLSLHEFDGTFVMDSNVSGYLDLPNGSRIPISLNEMTGSFFIQDDDHPKEEREFPWSILIFLLVAGILILIVTYLRYGSHLKDQQQEEGGDIHTHRRPISRDHIRRVDGPMERRVRGPVRERSKRSEKPPWK